MPVGAQPGRAGPLGAVTIVVIIYGIMILKLWSANVPILPYLVPAPFLILLLLLIYYLIRRLNRVS